MSNFIILHFDYFFRFESSEPKSPSFDSVVYDPDDPVDPDDPEDPDDPLDDGSRNPRSLRIVDEDDNENSL